MASVLEAGKKQNIEIESLLLSLRTITVKIRPFLLSFDFSDLLSIKRYVFVHLLLNSVDVGTSLTTKSQILAFYAQQQQITASRAE